MNKRTVLIYTLIAVACLLALSTVFTRRFLNPKAQVGTPEFNFSTNPATLNKNGTAEVIVSVKPNGTTFNTFALEFTYNTNDFTLQTSDINQSFAWVYQGNFRTAKLQHTTENSVGRIRLEAALLQSTIGGGSTPVPLFKILFNTKNPSTASTSLAWNTQSLLLFNGSSSVPVSAVNGTIPFATGVTPQTTDITASIHIATDKTSYTPGDTVALKVFLRSGTPPDTGTLSNFVSSDVVIRYTDNGIAPKTNSGGALQVDSPFQEGIATVDQNQTRITLAIPFLSKTTGQATTIDKSQPIATIYFIPKSGIDQNGKTESFAIETNSKIYITGGLNTYIRYVDGTNNIQTVSFGATPSTSPSPSLSPSPSISPPAGTAQLTFTTRLQGVVATPTTTTLPVTLTVAGGTLSAPKAFTTNITWQGEGIWSGSLALEGVPLSTQPYSIYLKGPKHLRKRICTLSPGEDTAEGSCNTPQIVINTSAVTANWSSVRLLVGDLAPQDGVLNTIDVAKMRSSVLSQNADTISDADLNYDGVVNGTDVSLFLESMQRKYDDEIIETTTP